MEIYLITKCILINSLIKMSACICNDTTHTHEETCANCSKPVPVVTPEYEREALCPQHGDGCVDHCGGLPVHLCEACVKEGWVACGSDGCDPSYIENKRLGTKIEF